MAAAFGGLTAKVTHQPKPPNKDVHSPALYRHHIYMRGICPLHIIPSEPGSDASLMRPCTAHTSAC